MSSSLLERTRTLHEDIERLEHLSAQFLLEEPKTHKESVNQSHLVAQVLQEMSDRKDKLLEIYKDLDNSRKEDIEALGRSPQISLFYDKVREIKEYHKKFPDLTIDDPHEEFITAITGSSNVKFATEEGYGKYLDLHIFHDRYNNFSWMREHPVDYFTFLDIVFKFNSSLSGKGKEYHKYLTELGEYLVDHIRKSQPLFDIDQVLKNIDREFSKQWESGKYFQTDTRPISDEENNDSTSANSQIPKTYCLDCKKKFAKATVFNAHLKGKKHKKAAEINKPFEKDTFRAEFQVQQLGELLSEQLQATKVRVETKLARRYEDIEAELNDDNDEEVMQMSDTDSDDEEEMTRRCITNYPVGWDGKPIPYWLYKLHGLGIEYKCEICGNTSYWGRRAFERHFQEWRHAYGMRCLGIPNSKHFHEITSIRDALVLWEKIKENKQTQEWNANEQEEFEDNEGNVMNRKTYKDLERQGLLN